MPRRSPYDIRLSAEEARDLTRRAAKQSWKRESRVRANVIPAEAGIQVVGLGATLAQKGSGHEDRAPRG